MDIEIKRQKLRKYLSRLYKTKKYLGHLKRTLKDFKADSDVIPSHNYSNVRVMSKNSDDRTSSYAIHIDELEHRIESVKEKINNLKIELKSLFDVFDELDIYYQVLEARYIFCMSWKQISNNLCYEIESLSRLEKQAIDELLKNSDIAKICCDY